MAIECGPWTSTYPIYSSQQLIREAGNPLSHDNILDWSKLKGFADNMKMAESSPNEVENTVGKGEIAH